MTLTTGLLIALVVPVVFAVMSIMTGNFYYNLGATGTCIILLAASPNPIAVVPVILCFLLSIAGDYFMGHQANSKQFYLFGIIAFFFSHCCLIWYSYPAVDYVLWQLILGAVLALGFGLYFAFRILPNVKDVKMQVAMVLYASVSVLSLMMAVSMNVPLLQRVLYALGVLSIVVSDTFIADCDFGGNDKLSKGIMPTYFLCHLLITASCLVSMM